MQRSIELDELERLFRRAPVTLFTTDCDLTFTGIFGTAAQRFPQEFVGRSLSEFFRTHEDHESIREAFARVCSGERTEFQATWRGAVYRLILEPQRSADGTVIGTMGLMVDVTETERLRLDLQSATRALQQAETLSALAYYTVDLQTEILEITPAFARIYGFPEDTSRVTYSEFMSRIHPDDRLSYSRQRARTITGKGPFSTEYRVVQPSGNVRHVRVFGSVFFDKNGAPVRGVGTVIDDTEHIETQRGLRFLTEHDGLTGLLNRATFDARAREAIARSQESREGIAIIFLGIDRFGEIVDVAGHPMAEQLLRAVADRLRGLDELKFPVARMAGDEFACLVTNVRQRQEIERCIDRIRGSLRAPIVLGQHSQQVSVSIGVAMFNVSEDEVTLLTRAHMAMLSARAHGRAGVVWYSADLERVVTMRHRIEQDLDQAMDRGDLDVYYQAIVDARNEELIAVEALVRWVHPELGFISPASFIPVAEETGQLLRIGDWVIDRACHDLKAIQERFGRQIRVNVNVSPVQLLAPRFADRVHAIAIEAAVPPECIQLEVTEQSLILDVERAGVALRALFQFGFSIAIDDFGTGYNTLSYLKSYPVSFLKIDRMFVRDLESDEYSRAICSSLLALARALHVTAIGEGIETPQQADFLRDAGCDELQGFLYAKAVPLDHLLSQEYELGHATGRR